MSIRNLRGAPSFGESSKLEIHDLPRGGTSNNQHTSFAHRKSQNSARFLPSHYHHMAGEVIGSSYTGQPNGGSVFSSLRRPRARTTSHELFTIKNSFSGESEILSNAPIPPASPAPSPTGRFRKFRAVTWDSGMGRMSPMGRANNEREGFVDDNSPCDKMYEAADEELQKTLKTSNVIAEHDIFLEDSSSESGIYSSSTSDEDLQKRIDSMQKLPISFVQCAGIGETKQTAEKRESLVLEEVEDDETRDYLRKIVTLREKRRSMDTVGSETTESKREVKFADQITEYEIMDTSQRRASMTSKNVTLLNDCVFNESSESLTHPNPKRRNAIDQNSITISKRAMIETSLLSRELQTLQEQQQKQLHDESCISKLNPFRNLSWSLVGNFIVRSAPCFWCMKKKLSISATDREILMRLNALCSIFCVVQIALGLFLFITTIMGLVDDNNESKNPDTVAEEDEDSALPITPDLWNLKLFVYMLSVVNAVLLIASTMAQRVIREVNLVGSVRYMWSLFWLLPIQIFFMIGLFDYYKVMAVWIKHYWDDPSMAFMRDLFCEEGTANDECMVPIMGGEEYANEAEWCEANYNKTNCQSIRDEAQEDCRVASYVFFTSNGVWALILVVLMWVTLSVLQAIITMPIVQRSKASNIPLWLTLPTFGCFILGSLLLYAPNLYGTSKSTKETSRDLYLMGVFYFVSGGAFALAALVGCFLKFYSVLNRREKKFKQGFVVIFIVTIFITIFSVATIFTTSLIYTLNLVDLSQGKEIACTLDFGGSCTGCDSKNTKNMCPEWSDSDVETVLKTIMKQSATLAAIFLVYALVTLRYGFLLFRHVSSYHIEYV